jgi:hypothetical protein
MIIVIMAIMEFTLGRGNVFFASLQIVGDNTLDNNNDDHDIIVNLIMILPPYEDHYID